MLMDLELFKIDFNVYFGHVIDGVKFEDLVNTYTEGK